MESVSFVCPSCGGKLFFNPDIQKLSCESCKNSYLPNEITKYDRDLDVEIIADCFGNDDNTVSYTCDSCGGEIIVLDSLVSTSCPFCGNNILAKKSLAGSYRPKYVVPFSKNKNDAKSLLNQYLKKNILLPTRLKKELNEEKMNDIYIPLYLVKGKACFDFSKVGAIDGLSVIKNADDVIPSAQITLYGKVNFSHFPVNGLKELDDDLVEVIGPFDIDGIKQFDSSYLAGHMAKRYDVSFKDLKNTTSIRIRDDIYTYVREKEMLDKKDERYISYYVSNIELYHTQATYLFYPMWFLEHEYKGKKTTIAINDRNGKIFGIVPASKLKITFFLLLFVLAYLVVIFGILFAITKLWLVSLVIAFVLGSVFGILSMVRMYKSHYAFKKQFKQYIDPESYSLNEKRDPITTRKKDIEREIEEIQKKISGQERSMVNAMDITTQRRQYHENIAKLNGLVSASRQVYKSKIDEERKKIHTYTKDDLKHLINEMEAQKIATNNRYSVGLINKEYNDVLQEYYNKKQELYKKALEKLDEKEE